MSSPVVMLLLFHMSERHSRSIQGCLSVCIKCIDVMIWCGFTVNAWQLLQGMTVKANGMKITILRNGFMFDNRTTKKRIIPTSSSLPSCLGSLTRTLFIFFSSVESMSEHRKCSNLARLQQRRSLCVQHVSSRCTGFKMKKSVCKLLFPSFITTLNTFLVSLWSQSQYGLNSSI